MRTTLAIVASMTLALVGGCSAADGEGEGEGEGEDACADARQHVCDNIEGQACSTQTMGDAMDAVRDACGADEAAAFASAVEDACDENALEACLEL